VKEVPPPADIPPQPKQPPQRETPPLPKRPPADRPPEPVVEDPAAPPRPEGGPSVPALHPGGVALPDLNIPPQNIPLNRPADPFRRPDGTSRLLGAGRADAPPSHVAPERIHGGIM
jgi:hypothetical protein